MLLSQSSQYAISGVLRLASMPKGDYCRVEDLVRGTTAPHHAVAKVFHELAKRGILRSARGTGGGFRLAEGWEQMTLMDVVQVVDGPWNSPAVAARGLSLPDEQSPLSQILQPIQDRLEQALRSVRIGDLSDTCSCCTPTAAPDGHLRAAPLGRLIPTGDSAAAMRG